MPLYTDPFHDRPVPPRAPEPGDTLAVPGEPAPRSITKLAVVHYVSPAPRYIVETVDGDSWLCFERRTPASPLPPTAHQYLALERLADRPTD